MLIKILVAMAAVLLFVALYVPMRMLSGQSTKQPLFRER